MVKAMGGWPGDTTRVRATIAAGASARDTSSITASSTAPAGRAMRSR
jgi:hypothetical protein